LLLIKTHAEETFWSTYSHLGALPFGVPNKERKRLSIYVTGCVRRGESTSDPKCCAQLDAESHENTGEKRDRNETGTIVGTELKIKNKKSL